MDEYLEPIVVDVDLSCDRHHAFTTYVTRIGEWWDPRYSANPETLQGVTIDAQVGGRIYATHTDLGRHDWGELLVFEPGRLVHTFTLAQDPGQATEIDVRFVDRDGGGTSVRLVHGGWTASMRAVRSKFGDWPVLLAGFSALADA